MADGDQAGGDDGSIHHGHEEAEADAGSRVSRPVGWLVKASTTVLDMNANSPSTEKGEAPWRDFRLAIQQLRFQLDAGGLMIRVFLDRAVGDLFLRARHADVRGTGGGEVRGEITRGYRFYGRGSHCCATAEANFEARVCCGAVGEGDAAEDWTRKSSMLV